MSLDQQKIVIVGGSSGIGLATAKAAVAARAIVTIAGRSSQKLDQAKQQMNGQVETAILDLLQEEDLQTFFKHVGVIDHLVVTGSSTQVGAFRELDTQIAKQSMESKFWGAYRAAKYAQVNSSGSIVFVSGILSRRPTPGSAILAAINAALEGLGRALAIELAPIRVNVVCPGIIQTPIYDKMPEAQREQMYRNASDRLPVKRVGQPEDVAQSMLYLLQNGYSNGTVIDVDGGGALV